MADAGFFKGTSAEQDRRFSDKELKLLKTMKFPTEFDKKVDMRKVNLQVIRPWVAKKIVELVGSEDEVLVEYAMGLMEDTREPFPNPRKMHINLTGFLTKDTPVFMSALWKLLLEAQEEVSGVPRTFVEEKKEELRKARESDSRVIGERDRRATFDEIRDSERGGRGGGRGRVRGRGRGRGGGWGGDERHRGGPPGSGPRRRLSPSPPPRRRSPSYDSRSSRSRTRSPPPAARGGGRYRSPPSGGRRLARTPSRDAYASRSPPSASTNTTITSTHNVSSTHKRRLSRRSPVHSRSRSPPSRRRPRSPSYTPPRERERDRRYRDSRSPPSRRRRVSPPRRSLSPRSEASPPRGYYRRRSPSPPRRRRSVTPPVRGERRRSLSIPLSGSRSTRSSSRSLSPRRKADGRRRHSRSRSPEDDRRRARKDKMEVDSRDANKGGPSTFNAGAASSSGFGVTGELKIKGQAEIERRRSKWDDEGQELDKCELEKRENELKEKALRNKVVRSRKGGGN